jgi:3-oxoacyl-[acyl-carrier protein] reductase
LGWFIHGTCHVFSPRAALIISILLRLTAAKEQGASIEIDGKKVPLGIPTATKTPERESLFPTIPLGRGGTPDEAAAAMLLCVQLASIFLPWLISIWG